MKYEEIEGDIILFAKEGKFDVIVHGCNCFCRMRRGLAPQMVEAFSVNEFRLEQDHFSGDINKLGQIEHKVCYTTDNDKNGMFVYEISLEEARKRQPKAFAVVNAYTQYHWDTKTKPLDYEALTLCLRKINALFAGKHIGLPLIGCHLAGGIWDINQLEGEEMFLAKQEGIKDVKTIIKEELKDMDVTIVHYKP